jgi:hypothetical protein
MNPMPRPRVVTWNGKDVPPELRELPAGRYSIEAVEEEAPVLSPEEEAGIEAALESYRQGRVVDAKRARDSRRSPLALKILLTPTERAPTSSRRSATPTDAIQKPPRVSMLRSRIALARSRPRCDGLVSRLRSGAVARSWGQPVTLDDILWDPETELTLRH